MNGIIRAVALSFSLLSVPSHASLPLACVLVSEAESAPVVGVVRALVQRRAIADHWQIRFIAEAQPEHLVECASDPANKRILWIAHGSGMPDTGANLLYIRRVPEHLKQERAYEMAPRLRQRISQIRSYFDLNIEARGDLAHPLYLEEVSLQRQLTNLEAGLGPLYDPPLTVHNLFFERRLIPALRSRTVRLERFSLLACNRNALLGRYASLRQVSELTAFDLAPSNLFASWLIRTHLNLERADVSVTDWEWLRRQFQ